MEHHLLPALPKGLVRRAGAGRGQHIRQNADRKRRFGARDDDAQIKGAGVPRGVPDEHGAQASVDADQ